MKFHIFTLICLIQIVFGSLNSLKHKRFVLPSHQLLIKQQKPETNNKVRYNDQTAKRQVWLIYKQLNSGQAFDKLARQYSQDYGSFAVGGNLGWQKSDQFEPAYKGMVSRMHINQFSKPFKTEFGYHIVQLLDQKDGMVLTRHILIKDK